MSSSSSIDAPAPPSSADPKDRFYESQGLRLHYADWGNEAAPPLLLIHGGRDHCRSWDAELVHCNRIFTLLPPISAVTGTPTGRKAAATVYRTTRTT